MIVTRTPFRITLGGGGTDLPAFYEKHTGYVLALGIDKFMYVTMNVPYADRKVRLHYTQSETVDSISDLRHELAREAFRAHGIDDAVEVASLADLPAGTGLGSSSAYLVGLLTAIRAYLGKPATQHELASEAVRIELDVLGKPIGQQDQFMAAFGGLTELSIDRAGAVSVKAVDLPGFAINELVASTHLYYTNVQRTTTDILGEQTASLRAGGGPVESALTEIIEIGHAIGVAIKAGNFDEFGRLTHAHWEAKKRLSGKVSLPALDDLYTEVRSRFGVLGGKVVGAGGGGFLMLYTQAGGQALTEFMARHGMARLTYAAEYEGSRVLVNTMNGRSIADAHHSAARTPVRA